MTWRIIEGDCLDRLRDLDEASVQTCVSSPPYWGLRDYSTEPTVWGGDPECDHEWGEPIIERATNHVDKRRWQHTRNGRDEEQPPEKRVGWRRSDVAQGAFCRCGAWSGDLGLEPTPELYVEHIVEVFREVRRVLRDDGTLWLNLGDSYAGSWGAQSRGENSQLGDRSVSRHQILAHPKRVNTGSWVNAHPEVKPKDLVGIPWMVAFALRADGWYLRSDIIWSKPNPMPESVTDRPTKAHEYLFLLSKSPRYFYDADAIREDAAASTMAHQRHEGTRSYGHARIAGVPGQTPHAGSLHVNGADRPTTANRRTVWTVATQPFPGAHFATFPPKLIEPCILAGSPPKCCGECGAPWGRVVRRLRSATRVEPTTEKGEARASGDGYYRQNTTETGGVGGVVESETVGWRPTCEHDDDSGCATVLDPFAGAGTTGVVATRLDRSFVGIELNPEYAEMARNRIRDDAPLLNVGLEAAA